MNEGFRNLALLVWALCAVNSNSYAQDSATVITEESSTSAPTIVYGAARKADGETDEVLIEQPAGAPNPLGNPLPDAAEQQQPQAVTEPVPAEMRIMHLLRQSQCRMFRMFRGSRSFLHPSWDRSFKIR